MQNLQERILALNATALQFLKLASQQSTQLEINKTMASFGHKHVP
jgi:hypothetical protein